MDFQIFLPVHFFLFFIQLLSRHTVAPLCKYLSVIRIKSSRAKVSFEMGFKRCRQEPTVRHQLQFGNARAVYAIFSSFNESKVRCPSMLLDHVHTPSKRKSLPVQGRLLCKHLVPQHFTNHVVGMARLGGQTTSLPLIYHDTCIKLAGFRLFGPTEQLPGHIGAKLKWANSLFIPQQGTADETSSTREWIIGG